MSSNHKSTTAENAFRHIRPNPVTGEPDYYFPLEITDPSIRALARERGLEIARTRLGNRVFEAVMVPCKETAMIHGEGVYIDTPSEVQRRRYHELIRDELAAQAAGKEDGRCQIPNGRGGLKRCPSRVPNPDYVPGGDQPKTLPVKCEGCRYEEFRWSHDTIQISALALDDGEGNITPYEPAATKDPGEPARYSELRDAFIAFVKEKNPKLAPLAELLTLEFTKSEAGRALGDASSTVTSRAEKLEELLLTFLETIA